MALTADQVLQVAVLGRSQSQAIVNVFHYAYADPSTIPPEGNDIAFFSGPFRALWRLHILPLLSDTYSVEVYQFRSIVSTIEDDPGPPPERRVILGDAFDLAGTALDGGAVAGPVSPTFVAVGARKVTARAGRRFRGGSRFGPIVEADTNNQVLGGTVFDAWVAAVQAFYLAPLPPGMAGVQEVNMVVFSKTAALEPAPPQTNLEQFTARVTGSIINEFVTSQVSRKASAGTPT